MTSTTRTNSRALSTPFASRRLSQRRGSCTGKRARTIHIVLPLAHRAALYKSMRICEGANHTPRFRRTLKESHSQVHDPSKNRHRRGLLPTVNDRQATLCRGGQSPSTSPPYGRRPASHTVLRRPVAIGESSLRPTTGKPLCLRRPVAIGEPSTCGLIA